MKDIIGHVDNLRDQLRTMRGSFREIAEQSGLSYHWLVSFAQGKIQNPTLKNIAALHDVFEKRKEAGQ